jgi:RNA polymerase sigma-70 factor, ECF subfamily
MVVDEQLLVARIAAGDDEALRKLYGLYRPRLRRYLWYQLDGDFQAVEEALQDVFLAVWRTAGAYRGEARAATWIYQIAHYHVLRAQRSRHLHDGLFAGDVPNRPDDGGAPSERLSIASHEDAVLDRLALAEAFHQLSVKHRAVLDLVFQHGFSLEETAQVLDVPLGTVKSRISYARRSLQRALSALATERAPRHG